VTVASAGALTGFQVSVTVPAPGVAAEIAGAGSVPTVADALADAEAPVQ
jgi:hypothetical protein